MPTSARASATRRHHAQREQTEQWLDEKKVSWTFHPAVELDEFDKDRSLRNQARITQTLNETTVETYTEAKRNGDIFPALVCWRDKKTKKLINIDGNHRLWADEAAGTKPAVYELDPNTHPNTLVLLTYEANAKHGLPNSVEDRTRHAVYLVESATMPQEEAAARLNITKAALSRALSRKRADDRATKVGLLPRHWNTISQSAKARLGNVRTDEGFEALADLAYRAGMSMAEIEEAVVAVNRSRSAAEQRRIVAELSETFKERIQIGPGGQKTYRQTPKGRLNIAHSYLRNITELKDVFAAQIADAELDDYITKCEDTAQVLLDLSDALREKQKGA